MQGKMLLVFLFQFHEVVPSPIAQLVGLQTWEQEVAGSFPESANILSKDWW